MQSVKLTRASRMQRKKSKNLTPIYCKDCHGDAEQSPSDVRYSDGRDPGHEDSDEKGECKKIRKSEL